MQRETLQKHVRQPKKGCIIFGQTQTNMIIMSVVITLRVSDHHLYHEWQWLAVNTPLWLHQLPKMGVQQKIILCSKIRANNYTKSASWVPVAFPEVCVHRKKVIMSPKPARCIANQTRWPRKGTSIVVVLPATRDMCMMRKPSKLSANARFSTVLNNHTCSVM